MTVPDPKALEYLLQCTQAANRARRFVVYCLVVLVVGLTGIVAGQVYTAHQASVHYKIATARYQEASADRRDLHDQLGDALALLRKAQRACLGGGNP